MYDDHATDHGSGQLIIPNSTKRLLGLVQYRTDEPIGVFLLDMSVTDPSTILARYVPLYRYRYPHYQVTLLSQLQRHWEGHQRVLDIGGGSGVIAEAVHIMLGSDVTSIDVANRFAQGLTIKTGTYDGVKLPFPDGSFDAITFINVIHHIPSQNRAPLLKECARVCSGVIYIKDHAFQSKLDLIRLHALDAMGNLPFGGMVKAQHVAQAEWDLLRCEIGYVESDKELGGGYRRGMFAKAFPDRLESFRKWIRP